MKTHYVVPHSSPGATRMSICGVICQAGGGHDGTAPVGTTRVLSTRCRACVMVLRTLRTQEEQLMAVLER